MTQPALPVLSILPELIKALTTAPITLLAAPPGTGKSTVLPLELKKKFLAPGRKMIMLEPRRLAARNVASRMAFLENEPVGAAVGYRVRFETKTSPATQIEVVTDGIMTRLLQLDPSLDGVDLVVFDEFHERSLQADLALALCRQAQALLRPDLKILVMSATLDTGPLSEILDGAPVIKAEGIQYPVEIRWARQPATGHWLPEMTQLLTRVFRETTGDILAFLPGGAEINRVRQSLEQQEPAEKPVKIHALFGDLPLTQQQQAIEPSADGSRKLILATSIAETSLTIEGVSVVVDAGLQRLPFFEPRTGLTRMETVRVTRDAAAQRTGRAGRLGPGICYRLWTNAEHHQFLEHRKPEIVEADLASLVLELALWGVYEPDALEWVTLPPAATWFQAKNLLVELGALDAAGITMRGRQMAGIPAHPRLAHMLLEAANHKERNVLLPLACDLTALLEERDPFPRTAGSDLSARIDALRLFRSGERVNADRTALERIERISLQWRRDFRVQPDNKPADPYITGQLLLDAYPERLARCVDTQNARYKLQTGNYARLRPEDTMVRAEWIVAAHVDAGSVQSGGFQEGRIYLAAPVHDALIREKSLPKTRVFWDEEKEAVTGVLEQTVGRLVLSSKPLQRLPDSDRIQCILDRLRDKGLRFLQFNETVERLRDRAGALRSWRPELSSPDLGDDALMTRLEDWLVPFLGDCKTAQEIRNLDFVMIFSALFTPDQLQQLERLAPGKLPVPSGSLIHVNYARDGQAPVMEVRLQELFGLAETPAVNGGRIPVTLHLLSPGYKPVQVTRDLRSFWNNTYAEVRKELRMRYPKHSWPDDPWTAEAVRGAKKRT